MPPLSRFESRPSIHSWWSDSNPLGATFSLHAVTKPLIKYLYHRQARELVRKTQGIALEREVMEVFASYLTYKYVSHGTKALILEELAARSDSDVNSDATVIVGALRGEGDIFPEMLKSSNAAVKYWAYELLINLAHNKSAAWISCLPWTPCTPFVDLLGEQETRGFALSALYIICKSRAGAETIVAAQALKRIMDLNLIQSPDSNLRAGIVAILDHLSQHELISSAVLGVGSQACAQLVALPKDSYSAYVLPPAWLELTGRDRQVHRQELKQAKAKMASQVKILLLGSGDSEKSTMLKQMRLTHMPFSAREIESYRRFVFCDLTRGFKCLPVRVLGALSDSSVEVKHPTAYTHVYPVDDSQDRGGYVQGWAPGECGGMSEMVNGLDEEGVKPDMLLTDVELIKSAPDLCDGQPFPLIYLGPLQRLWDEEVLHVAWAVRNDTGLVLEDLQYFFRDLPRLFDTAYVPTAEDILHTGERTNGITETTIKLKEHEFLMIDVSGQHSERRKWIHCFQDVTSILFFVNLSGYDQDRHTNQMQDAMTVWDSICHSPWFKQTSIILVLTKYDIFQKKIKTSQIRTFFPDFDGEPENAVQGRDYFKKRFGRLALKAGPKDRGIYIHTTSMVDAELLRVVMYSVEE